MENYDNKIKESKELEKSAKLPWQTPELKTISLNKTESGTFSTNPTMEGTFYSPATS